jgi:hypothetical protein
MTFVCKVAHNVLERISQVATLYACRMGEAVK